jgi:hypothetical protein
VEDVSWPDSFTVRGSVSSPASDSSLRREAVRLPEAESRILRIARKVK